MTVRPRARVHPIALNEAKGENTLGRRDPTKEG
jgi:hypothetical protein